jgi:hypothetical protein
MNAPETPKQAIAADKPEKTLSPYQAMNLKVAEFVVEYRKESDRACVILCAAKIDYLCGQILAKFLLPNASGQDDLLDTDRAIGTFSARIHALYRLGLIDAEFARALQVRRPRIPSRMKPGELPLADDDGQFLMPWHLMWPD